MLDHTPAEGPPSKSHEALRLRRRRGVGSNRGVSVREGGLTWPVETGRGERGPSTARGPSTGGGGGEKVAARLPPTRPGRILAAQKGGAVWAPGRSCRGTSMARRPCWAARNRRVSRGTVFSSSRDTSRHTTTTHKQRDHAIDATDATDKQQQQTNKQHVATPSTRHTQTTWVVVFDAARDSLVCISLSASGSSGLRPSGSKSRSPGV